MSDLGQLLQNARMEKGITLEQLQETTKIRKRYLEAIEEGKYDILPGAFYVRAFIKQYAEVVGLDPEELLRMYSHAIPTTEQEQTAEPSRMTRRNVTPPSDRSSKWASALLMIAFPLLIVSVLYYYFVMNDNEPRSAEVPDVPLIEHGTANSPGSAVVDEPAEPQPEPAVEEPEVTLPPPEPEPDVTFAEKIKYKNADVERFEVRNADKLKIELKLVGTEAWIGISHADTKSKYLHQGPAKQGDTLSFEYDHNIYVNIGRANAIEMAINGVPVDMGQEPNPRKFQFELVKDAPPATE